MKATSADHLFAANLKAILDGRGITTTQLARAVGVTQPAIHRWVAHKGSPRLSTISKLSNFFDIDPVQFFKPIKSRPVKSRQIRKSA